MELIIYIRNGPMPFGTDSNSRDIITENKNRTEYELHFEFVS